MAKKNSFTYCFIKRYPQYNSLLTYMCEAIGKDYIEWSDLTKINLIRISDYINGKVSPNTAGTYIHVLHALLMQYSEEGLLPVKSLTGCLKSRRVPSQHVALSEEEVERFDAYKPKSTAERDVKALFMRACYTGARCSDAKLMTMQNIVHTPKCDYLSYVSQKTKTEVSLPVHSNLYKYLDYNITKDYSARTTSYIVRKICKSIGVNEPVALFVGGKRQTGEKWEFITMHSARRTFCTLLARMGVNVETIRTMAGHSSTTMTDRYVCLDGRNPGADAMKFFNNSK